MRDGSDLGAWLAGAWLSCAWMACACAACACAAATCACSAATCACPNAAFLCALLAFRRLCCVRGNRGWQQGAKKCCRKTSSKNARRMRREARLRERKPLCGNEVLLGRGQAKLS